MAYRLRFDAGEIYIVKAYPSNITNTGFTINNDAINDYEAAYGQWFNWLAYPPDTRSRLASGLFGVDNAAISQAGFDRVTFDKLGLVAAATPKTAVEALNKIVFTGGELF